MPRKIQDCGALNPQIDEIVSSALDGNRFVDVTTAGADTEFAVKHGLGRVPVGYIPIGQNKAGGFYNSTTAWTAESIYLKCDVATMTVRLLVF